MKVFVYSKKDNHTIAVINRVAKVESKNEDHMIYVFTSDNSMYSFDTKTVKTRIYQN